MRLRRICGLTCALTLVAAAPAAATLTPLDGQVNDDNAAGIGIDPARDAGVSDVVGGALTAGNLEIPWAAFEQDTAGAQNIFVRAFKGGKWVTEGFPATLNIDPGKEAEAPSIDFAGAGRTVPWVAWYEPNDAFGAPTQIFASRFAADAGAQGGGKWIPEGQDRAAPGKVPSLNINTDRTAENPALIGGTTTPGGAPVPWVAWEENDGTNTDDDAHRQIFVAKAVRAQDGGACPPDTKPAGGDSVGVFCWQQVGLPRLNPTTGASSATGDPSLNIDPTRAGVESDFAFTGPGDTVGWVTWYEEGPSRLGAPRDPNKQVFAAKLVADATADGGFRWQAVGNGTAGQVNPLDTSGAKGFGPCAATQAATRACTLNAVPTRDAENPRVAAGSLTAGAPTVPWIVWEEDTGSGAHAIFVSRLVGGDHFELVNAGQPISNPLNDSSRPDITFSGHTPYLSWHETVNGANRLFTGHFEGDAFKLDTPDGVTASAFGLTPDLRAPISSTCTATPFSEDGSACRGGALGTPFALFTDGGATGGKLFGEAYAPTDVTTGDASAIGPEGALVAGSVNPGGAPVATGFDAGTATPFGSATLTGTTPQAFAATLTGFPAATPVRYRAFARSDFTTVDGAERTFTTAAAGQTPPPPSGTNKRPNSAITGLRSTVKRRALTRFRGTARDAEGTVARVDIAVIRRGKACRVLGARGRLVKGTKRGGACAPRFLKATGTNRWSFTLKRKLPKGRYVLLVRATDGQGKRETSFARKAFRVT